MNQKIIRHQRVVNVRDLILKGTSLQDIFVIFLRQGISKQTIQSYIDEAIIDIKRRMKIEADT